MVEGWLTKLWRLHIIFRNSMLLIIIPFILFFVTGILTGHVGFACLTLILSAFIILLLIVFYPPLRNFVIKGYSIQRLSLEKIKEYEEAKKKFK